MSTTITIVVDAGTGSDTHQSAGAWYAGAEDAAGPPPLDELAGEPSSGTGHPLAQGAPLSEGPPPSEAGADEGADLDAAPERSAPEPMALEDLDD